MAGGPVKGVDRGLSDPARGREWPPEAELPWTCATAHAARATELAGGPGEGRGRLSVRGLCRTGHSHRLKVRALGKMSVALDRVIEE